MICKIIKENDETLTVTNTSGQSGPGINDKKYYTSLQRSLKLKSRHQIQFISYTGHLFLEQFYNSVMETQYSKPHRQGVKFNQNSQMIVLKYIHIFFEFQRKKEKNQEKIMSIVSLIEIKRF